jgi:ribonucleoside-diphosphate reductase alpha chain
MFTYEESFQNSLNYFNGDSLAAKVWLDKYALRDGSGNLLEDTPDKMHKRLADEFAKILFSRLKKLEIKDTLSEYGKNFYNLLLKKTEIELSDYIFSYFDKFSKIVPQGRVMAGLGVEESFRSLSNCLRLPPPNDSYNSILYSDSCLVAAAKRGCGYGLGISNLRPEGISVKNSANTSTGAVSFMHRFSFSTREVAQSGRRGACLIDMDVRHPDIEQFITSKSDLTKVTGANISVKCTDDFLDAVEKNEDYLLRFPINLDISSIDLSKIEYNKLINIENGSVKKVKAKHIFDLIVKQARDNAEPGVFFWDRMKNYDPASVYKKYEIDGTNACGEQPMAIGDTCRLILLNLFGFVLNPYQSNAGIDFNSLYESAYFQLILGDLLVDLEVKYIDRILNKIKSDPEPQNQKIIDFEFWSLVKDIAISGRRIGCGITGLADMIAANGIKYDSDKSLSLINDAMKTKMRAELDASIDLSILFGSFSGFDAKLEKNGNDFYFELEKIFPEQFVKMQKFGRRNVNWSTVAPAGSVSILTQTSSGCEPLFSPYYTRRVKINPNDKNKKIDFIDQNGDKWENSIVIHPKLKLFLDINNFSINQSSIEDGYKKSPYHDSIASNICWEKRIEIQSILQKYTTSAISTTLNLPENISEEIVKNIYIKSWKNGLKGQTIYRENSRTGVLIKEEKKKEEKIHKNTAPKRPSVLNCDVHHFVIKGIKYYTIVGIFNNDPYEIFTGINADSDGEIIINKSIINGKVKKESRGKYILINNESKIQLSNNHSDATADALTRLISTSLRHGVDISFIVDQLEKTKGEMVTFAKVLGRTLKKYIKDGTKVSGDTCPSCGGTHLVRENGCKTCKDCGYTACS